MQNYRYSGAANSRELQYSIPTVEEENDCLKCSLPCFLHKSQHTLPKVPKYCTSNILSEIVNPQKQELPKFLKGPHLRGGYTTGHFIPLPLNSGTLGSSGVPRYSYRTRGSNLMESHDGKPNMGIFKNYGPPLW